MGLLEKDPANRPQSMADVELLLCEAQVEAKVRTPFDEFLGGSSHRTRTRKPCHRPAARRGWREKLGDMVGNWRHFGSGSGCRGVFCWATSKDDASNPSVNVEASQKTTATEVNASGALGPMAKDASQRTVGAAGNSVVNQRSSSAGAAQGGAGVGTGKSGVDTPSNGVAPDLETSRSGDVDKENEPVLQVLLPKRMGQSPVSLRLPQKRRRKPQNRQKRGEAERQAPSLTRLPNWL